VSRPGAFFALHRGHRFSVVISPDSFLRPIMPERRKAATKAMKTARTTRLTTVPPRGIKGGYGEEGGAGLGAVWGVR